MNAPLSATPAAAVVHPPVELEALHAVSQSVERAFAFVDANTRIHSANRSLAALLGVTEADLESADLDQFVNASARTGLRAAISSVLLDAVPITFGAGGDCAATRASGGTTPIRIVLSRVVTTDGPLVLAGILDRSREASADRLLEHTYENLFNAAPTGMVMVDARGVIALVNRRLTDLFGYSAQELIGQSIEQLLPVPERDAHADQFQAYFAAPTSRSMGAGRDLRGLHKDGSEFPVEIGLQPLRTPSGLRVIAAIADISPRKKSEDKLHQLNAALEEFVYVASHDLRSPLRGIGDLLEWIREDLGDSSPESVTRNLDRAAARVTKMERIITDLLSFARVGGVDPDVRPVDLRQMVDRIRNLLAVDERFHVTLSAPDEPLELPQTPVETVLRNLIANAIKHHDLDSGNIEIRVLPGPRFTEFFVQDDGPGVAANVRERIFKLFQTATAAERAGSGLGLAISRRIVNAHGGSIGVRSAPDTRGATFRFTWPTATTREARV